MTHPERSEAQLAGSRFVRGAGVALPHFWSVVSSAGPWLEGSEPDWPPGGKPSGPARSTEDQR